MAVVTAVDRRAHHADLRAVEEGSPQLDDERLEPDP